MCAGQGRPAAKVGGSYSKPFLSPSLPFQHRCPFCVGLSNRPLLHVHVAQAAENGADKECPHTGSPWQAWAALQHYSTVWQAHHQNRGLGHRIAVRQRGAARLEKPAVDAVNGPQHHGINSCKDPPLPVCIVSCTRVSMLDQVQKYTSSTCSAACTWPVAACRQLKGLGPCTCELGGFASAGAHHQLLYLHKQRRDGAVPLHQPLNSLHTNCQPPKSRLGQSRDVESTVASLQGSMGKIHLEQVGT
jgi:hypothetical protein